MDKQNTYPDQYSETEQGERIERMVVPLRDFFGAIFFFSFGLSIDPLTLSVAVWLALPAVVTTIAGNFVAGMSLCDLYFK